MLDKKDLIIIGIVIALIIGFCAFLHAINEHTDDVINQKFMEEIQNLKEQQNQLNTVVRELAKQKGIPFPEIQSNLFQTFKSEF